MNVIAEVAPDAVMPAAEIERVAFAICSSIHEAFPATFDAPMMDRHAFGARFWAVQEDAERKERELMELLLEPDVVFP
jgi:hypothetical protein